MTEPNRQSGENEERIIEIEIERLRPFKEHKIPIRLYPDRLYAKPWYDDDQCTGLFRFRADTCAGRISAS